MTTFKEIRGNLIKSTSTDPANPQDGQIWYNSTSQVLKGQEFLEAWSSGGNLGTGRYGAGVGQDQNAAALVGLDAETPTATNITEEYDGSSWTAGGSTGLTAYRRSAAGVQTAGIAMGGFIAPNSRQTGTEEYNGSTWTTGGSLPVGAQFGNASGPQTATLYAVYNTASGDSAEGLEYNGSSWTAGANLNTARRQGAVIGAATTLTSALVAGGFNPPGSPSDTTTTESYNGTSWTSVTGMSNARHASGSSGIGTSASVFGGSTPDLTLTENWNGTAWSATANQATSVRRVHNGGGGTLAALAMGGNPGSTATEEFDYGPATRTFTTS
jgi:hypothetical protein